MVTQSPIAQSDTPAKSWICAQLGSREHYAIPRVLAGVRLHSLITDSWVKPGSLLARAPLRFARKLPGRYHPDLGGEVVHAFSYGRLCSDFVGRVCMLNYWDDILARNEWFQRRALKLLKGPTYAGLRSSPKGIFFFLFLRCPRTVGVFQGTRLADDSWPARSRSA